MRRDLRLALDAFVATHRGVRRGTLFGVPAAFAGRRAFAKLDARGLHLRLPAFALRATASQALPALLPARSADPAARGRRSGAVRPPAGRSVLPKAGPSSWTTITPASPDAARLDLLLEQAARHVALS